MNDVIGSGVYLSNPKEAAELLGPASIWAILAAGVSVLLLVLCFAEAGSLFDTPGSGYVYTRAAFGDFVGFEVGWMTWVARITSVAGLSVGFARVIPRPTLFVIPISLPVSSIRIWLSELLPVRKRYRYSSPAAAPSCK